MASTAGPSTIGTKKSKATLEDADLEVVFEDQQRINMFARNNARLMDLKEEIDAKEKELQNLEDASGDIMLLDDDQCIPYQVGEVFIHLGEEKAQEYLEKAKTELQEQLTTLKARADEIRGSLSELKIQLYAKFGENINLEDGDD